MAGVNVSKFTKRKENSSSVVVNNSSKGYSNTNNNITTLSGLDRMLWNIHDTGQDITEGLELPQLTVLGNINGRGGLNITGNAYIGGDLTVDDISADEINAYIGNISYIYSDYIETDKLKATTGEITHLTSTDITTDFLNVTKSAHFAELIIDKIKAAGGSVIFSCADGFKIESDDDIIQMPYGYYMLCWNAEDDRAETINMWERGDQAICMNFNDARVGVQTDVSSNYFWGIVYDAGTFDPAEDSDIYFNDSNYFDQNHLSQSEKAIRYSDNSDIVFEDKKHWIIVRQYDSNGHPLEITDVNGDDGPCYDEGGNISSIKAGNEIAMLGHRPTGSNDDDKRSNAIYIAAYDKGIERDLKAPFIAQYQGIVDFNLYSHKTTWFAAGNSTNYGVNNHVQGSFTVTNIEDLDIPPSYFILTDKAYIPVSSSWELGNSNIVNVDAMYILGDTMGYIGNIPSKYQDGLRLRFTFTYNGTQYPYVLSVGEGNNPLARTYELNINNVLQNSTFNGHLDGLTIEICKYENARYNALCQYNIPVIPNAGGEPGADGDDGEFYKLDTIKELAQVDVTGNFALYLQYQIQHVVGDTITRLDGNGGYGLKFFIWDESLNNNEGGMKPVTIPYDSTTQSFLYDKDGPTAADYEKTNVWDIYQDSDNNTLHGSLMHDRIIEVNLIKTSSNEVVERKIIPITLVAGAMFSVTDVITSRVTSSYNTAYSSYNMASQALQTANGFDQRVTKTETDISYQQDTITGLQTDVSRIQQTADAITSEIAKISGVDGENLLVNSSFQVSDGVDMPERWDYYNENTIVTSYESGSVNYVNINNNINQPSSGDGKGRGIIQNSIDRYDNVVQDLYGNHIYCFSFYGKKNSTYGEISCFIHYLDSTGTMLDSSLRTQVYYDFDLTDDWTRYCFIFRTPDYNNIHGFNIMLEYYGAIKRDNESTVSVRYNNVDIMMPMLLDYGEVTTEKQDLYGLYRLDGDTRIYYDVWTNGDYDAGLVPMWQGNSQDVSVSSSQIIQTASNIQLNVYNDLRQTGINITNGQIDLNANNTNIIGNLNLKDSSNGIILYDSNGNARVNILPSNVPDPNTSGGFDSRNFVQFYSDEVTKSSYDNVDTRTARQSIGYLQQNTSVTFNVTPEIYGIVSSTNSYVANSIPSITVYFYIYNSSSGGSSISSTTRTLLRTYNNGLYEYPSFTYTYNFSSAGTYYIEMRLVGDDSNDRYTRYKVNAFTDYTKKVDSLTYVGLDGLLVGTANTKYAKISKDGYEFRWIDQIDNKSDAIKMSSDGLQRLYKYDTTTSELSSWVGISGYKPATLITDSNVTALNSINGFYLNGSKITSGYYYLVQPNDCNIMIRMDSTKTPLYIRLTDGAGSESGTPMAGRCIYIRSFRDNEDIYVCHGNNTNSTNNAILEINNKSDGYYSKQIHDDTYMFMAIPDRSLNNNIIANWAIYSKFT